MSMDLYFWKAPVTDDPDKAAALLERHFDGEAVFPASPSIAALAERLLEIYPIRMVFGDEALAQIPEKGRGRYTDEELAEFQSAGIYAHDDDSPWADLPFDQTDGLLGLRIRWDTAGQVLDDIVRIAAEQDLVVYDPQGPQVYRGREAPTAEPLQRPSALDFIKVTAMVIPFAAATYAAWLIPWGWARWPLVAVGLLLTAAALLVLFSTIAAAMGLLDKQLATG